MTIDVSQVTVEYLVQFVRGEGEQLADDQTKLITQLAKAEGGGWTYQGFASTTEAVLMVQDRPDSAASRTAGVLLYFARKPVDLQIINDGVEQGASFPQAMMSRAQRRAAERKKK